MPSSRRLAGSWHPADAAGSWAPSPAAAAHLSSLSRYICRSCADMSPSTRSTAWPSLNSTSVGSLWMWKWSALHACTVQGLDGWCSERRGKCWAKLGGQQARRERGRARAGTQAGSAGASHGGVLLRVDLFEFHPVLHDRLNHLQGGGGMARVRRWSTGNSFISYAGAAGALL